MAHVWFQYYEKGYFRKLPKHYSVSPNPNPDPAPTSKYTHMIAVSKIYIYKKNDGPNWRRSRVDEQIIKTTPG